MIQTVVVLVHEKKGMKGYNNKQQSLMIQWILIGGGCLYAIISVLNLAAVPFSILEASAEGITPLLLLDPNVHNIQKLRGLPRFVNCSIVPAAGYSQWILPAKELDSSEEPCALLFFGLAKHFRAIVLPSIQENILQVSGNAKCDIFIHNYDITTVSNVRNNEVSDNLDPMEVYSLTDQVVMDTIDDFLAKRDMKFYADANMKPYKSMGWDRASLENMYKQWHSIERVWDLMQQKEAATGIRYQRVGLFRSDVQYVTPIDIFDGDAVIPKFGFLVNDRMFYGTYSNAHVWAKSRFPSVGCYVPRHRSIKMHSEFFMNDFVLRLIPNVTKKDICFYRVRANGVIWDDDCTKSYEFPKHLIDLNLTYN